MFSVSRFFNGISIFVGYLMPNPSVIKKKKKTVVVLFCRCWDNQIYTYPKGMSPKANIIGQLKIEFGYHDIAFQNFSIMSYSN